MQYLIWLNCFNRNRSLQIVWKKFFPYEYENALSVTADNSPRSGNTLTTLLHTRPPHWKVTTVNTGPLSHPTITTIAVVLVHIFLVCDYLHDFDKSCNVKLACPVSPYSGQRTIRGTFKGREPVLYKVNITEKKPGPLTYTIFNSLLHSMLFLGLSSLKSFGIFWNEEVQKQKGEVGKTTNGSVWKRSSTQVSGRRFCTGYSEELSVRYCNKCTTTLEKTVIQVSLQCQDIVNIYNYD